MSLLDQILSLFAIPGAWLHQRLLRNCLLLNTNPGNPSFEENFKVIWECKNNFRAALKDDVNLLLPVRSFLSEVSQLG